MALGEGTAGLTPERGGHVGLGIRMLVGRIVQFRCLCNSSFNIHLLLEFTFLLS